MDSAGRRRRAARRRGLPLRIPRFADPHASGIPRLADPTPRGSHASGIPRLDAAPHVRRASRPSRPRPSCLRPSCRAAFRRKRLDSFPRAVFHPRTPPPDPTGSTDFFPMKTCRLLVRFTGFVLLAGLAAALSGCAGMNAGPMRSPFVASDYEYVYVTGSHIPVLVRKGDSGLSASSLSPMAVVNPDDMQHAVGPGRVPMH